MRRLAIAVALALAAGVLVAPAPALAIERVNCVSGVSLKIVRTGGNTQCFEEPGSISVQLTNTLRIETGAWCGTIEYYNGTYRYWSFNPRQSRSFAFPYPMVTWIRIRAASLRC
jgi:hypothetical protein